MPELAADQSDESRAEQGLAGWRDGNMPSSVRESVRSRWAGIKFRAAFGIDPFELVRLLGIDVGHGLQSLHENHFTHGDLKPENVLVFQTHDGCVAKL